MNRELDRLQKEAQFEIETVNTSIETVENHLTQVRNEYNRVVQLSGKADNVIDEIDRNFRKQTKLSGSDTTFLFLATGLQCARQYILTNDKYRISATKGDQVMEDTIGKATGLIKPKWNDVLFQSVPYDAYTDKNVSHVSSTGLSGTTHRYRTLGHDPILGWIFGTANIMTNSLTKSDFNRSFNLKSANLVSDIFPSTYQVSDNIIIRHYPGGTGSMLSRATNYAKSDPKLLVASVARQAIHFGSDYFTSQSLPIPLMGSLNPEMAHKLMNSNLKNPAQIDMWSITRGATLSALINQLVAIIHRLFYNEERDGNESFYEVRTRKILTYSNALATGSNVIVTAFSKDLTKLDVGGALVTLHRFVNDYKFIHEIKRDFLANNFCEEVKGKPYDFMEGNYDV